MPIKRNANDGVSLAYCLLEFDPLVPFYLPGSQ